MLAIANAANLEPRFKPNQNQPQIPHLIWSQKDQERMALGEMPQGVPQHLNE